MNAPETLAAVDELDTSFLESLMGYNARRATLVIVDAFLKGMAVHDLRPVDFSVLSVIAHNSGVTSRQLCSALNIQPPNLVGMLNTLEKRGLIHRVPHPRDGRAMSLHLTSQGVTLIKAAEKSAAELEAAITSSLSAGERKTLMALLKKIYA
jgi:DNA-binding MarR family transcriptional regulator